MKRPWDQFYYSDWRSDPALRMCSLAARGLWLELLALMHEAEPRGQLLIKGVEPTLPQLSSLVGATVEEVTDLLAELETNQVFSRKKNGVIYSRRMERKTELSRKRAEAGSKGGRARQEENLSRKNGESPEKKERIFGDRGSGKSLENNETPDLLKQNDKQRASPRGQRLETRVPEKDPLNPPEGETLLPDEKEDLVDRAITEFVAFAQTYDLPVPRVRNDRLRRQIRMRLKEIGGLDGWRQALQEIRQSPFCLGHKPARSPTQTPFRVDIWKLAAPEFMAKLLSGNYREDGYLAQPAKAGFDPVAFDWARCREVPAGVLDDEVNRWRWRLGQFYGRNFWNEKDWGPLSGPESKVPGEVRAEMAERYGPKAAE